MKLSAFLLIHPEFDPEIGNPPSAAAAPVVVAGPATDFDSAERNVLAGLTLDGYVNHTPEEMPALIEAAKAGAAAHPDVDPRVYVVATLLGWNYAADLAGWTPERLWVEKLSTTGLGPSGGPA